MAPHRPRLLSWLILLLPLAATPLAPGGPIEFQFIPPQEEAVKNPFARELTAEVITPTGRHLLLPAFYVGNLTYAVRARPDEVGHYRLSTVHDTTAGHPSHAIEVTCLSARDYQNTSRTRLPAIAIDPAHPRSFHRSDGLPFVPVGTNLAWPEGDCVPFYRTAIETFAKTDLNWMRIWMVHWGQLNLDWLPAWAGTSPKPGGLDPRIADNWDAILSTAEEKGIYVQMVFQHHGQFTTGANSNWKDHPWNAANPGGFLATPADFFKDPNARLMTMLKYRYIVARWGWSPAVFAWELFNEVHWVDAIDKQHDETTVARWHDDMAAYLRSIDTYGHLITTSTDNLRSPIYAQMDFYQPHLYSADLVAGARSAPLPAGVPVRPVFYGEFGTDHVTLPTADLKAGGALVPPAWAGLMGEARLPALPWSGAELLQQQRTAELGAVLRFALLSRFARQTDLAPFSAVVETVHRLPLVIAGCQVWQRRAAPEFTLPLDGRLPLELADIPRIYIGWPGSRAEGFPAHATYRFTAPRDTTFRARLVGTGTGGTAVRLTLDERTVAEKAWPAGATGLPTPAHPAELSFPVSAGPHTLTVANSSNADWFDLAEIDTGLDTGALGAIGQRNDRFLAVWVWHRTGLYSATPAAATTGTLVLEAVPAGTWTITWWDTLHGKPSAAPVKLDHPGGILRLATPAITRHAAVVLTR